MFAPARLNTGKKTVPCYSQVQLFAGVPTPESLLPSMEVRMTREWS